MNTLYLCGAGNAEGVRLAQRVNAQHPQWQRIVLLDDDASRHGVTLLSVPIQGSIDELALAGPGSAAVNLVARTTAGRAAVHARIAASGVPFATLVHPGVDAADCDLGTGVLVYEQAILSPLTRLGDGACVLMRALIGHDAVVGAGCVVAAGAVLNARVVLEERVYVGTNASVLPDVRIGAGATVGANTLVAHDVPAGATVIGVPGQIVASTAAFAAPLVSMHDTYPASAEGAVLEAQLLALLHAVLGEQRAEPTDRFFDVGGTSLRAIQFVEAIRARLGHDVPLPVLYARCTVRELAMHLLGGVTNGAAQVGQSRAALRRQMMGRAVR